MTGTHTQNSRDGAQSGKISLDMCCVLQHHVVSVLESVDLLGDRGIPSQDVHAHTHQNMCVQACSAHTLEYTRTSRSVDFVDLPRCVAKS